MRDEANWTRIDGESQVDKVIRSRRSVRRFLDKEIPMQILREVVEAARWAPSPHNVQPWRFALTTSAGAKAKLAEAMGARFTQDLLLDGFQEAEADRLASLSFERITRAQAVVVVCLEEKGLKTYPDARQELERQMAVQSIGAAIQNLLLAAHDHGLGACWVAAPLFCQPTVVEALDLDRSWQPQAMVLLGYPAVDPKVPNRFSLDDCLVFR